MKRIYLLFFIILALIGVICYCSSLFKDKTIASLKADATRITTYKNWGYDTSEFEAMYTALVSQAKDTTFILFPFQKDALQKKHDNILRLTQAGYATEISKEKELLQSRLSYLRERVKNSTSLSQTKKQEYSDVFEVVAGKIFELNSDLNEVKNGLKTLTDTDNAITKEIETVKKESLMSELAGYKSTCQQLYSYFDEKKSSENVSLAATCINEADKLMGPGYKESGADFLATLARERVFTLTQKAAAAKQTLIQEEQYALEAKKREEEKLTLVPPAPRQEGKVVVVNLALQRLYAYDNGKSIFDAAVPITTGKYGFETVTGEFAIYLKEEHHKMVSPFPGIYYDDVVNYWMPFYLGYGLHDAPWRSVYGTQDYPVVGSHGCVNIPLNSTIVLYNWAEVGTRVIVI
jgi:lipoprotein-anchoring transpeptidase ErfK/SrfK